MPIDPKHAPVLLVVDDEPDNLIVMKAIVSHYFPQCRVVTARHGEEALHITREMALDGALIDMQMPGMSGIDLCKRLKERANLVHVPLLLMSAFPTTPAIRAQGLHAGAVDFISKPINNEELAAKICVMLREKEGRDRLRQDNVQLEAEIETRKSALVESEARLRAVVEYSPDVIFSLDHAGRILFANRLEPIPHARIGALVADLLPVSISPLFTSSLETCLTRGIPDEMAYEDALGRWWFLRLAPTPQAENVGAMVIFTDITEKMKAERTLRETEERFRLVLDNLDALVYASDMETHELLFVNRLGKSIFGDDSEGKTCWRVFHDSHHPTATPCAKYRRMCHADPSSQHSPLEWQTQLSNQHWYNLRGNPIRWLNGRPAILVVATDVTSQKAMEDNLRHSQRMEAVGTLTSGIAHDFNNILGALMGNLELSRMEMGKNPEWAASPICGRLEQATAACMRGREVVRQLLTFSRPGDGRREPFSLGTLLEEAVRFMKSSFYPKLKVVIDLPEKPILVLGDATQIYQVIINLCTNANQAVGENGGLLEFDLKQATVDATQSTICRIQPGEYAMLSCRDTGCGIPIEVLTRVFDPFFTTKGQGTGSGSGLGLAVVHSIVKGHAGTILVESQEGKGSCFQVLLPMLITAANNEEASASTRQIDSDKKKRILVVDDDSGVLDIMGELLEVLGYPVQAFADPEAALHCFEENPDSFLAIITDQQMPRITGVALRQKIRDLRPKTPILLCTGNALSADLDVFRTDPCAGFIEKPFTAEGLMRSLQHLEGGMT